jgi:hypothetical protein
VGRRDPRAAECALLAGSGKSGMEQPPFCRFLPPLPVPSPPSLRPPWAWAAGSSPSGGTGTAKPPAGGGAAPRPDGARRGGPAGSGDPSPSPSRRGIAWPGTLRESTRSAPPAAPGPGDLGDPDPSTPSVGPSCPRAWAWKGNSGNQACQCYFCLLFCDGFAPLSPGSVPVDTPPPPARSLK